MIENKIIVIRDGMSDEEIFKMLNADPAPLMADMRTLVHKSIEQIVREQYGKDNAPTIPEGSNRPDTIKITA